MKMKIIKLYLLAGFASLTLTACSGSDPVQVSEQQTQPVQEPQIYTHDVTLSSKGSEQVVTLNQLQTPVAAVENSSTWLTVEAQPYTSGSPQVRLCSTDNTANEERKCSVTIAATSGDKVIMSITQQKGYEGTGIDDLHGSQTDKPAYHRKR